MKISIFHSSFYYFDADFFLYPALPSKHFCQLHIVIFFALRPKIRQLLRLFFHRVNH